MTQEEAAETLKAVALEIDEKLEAANQHSWVGIGEAIADILTRQTDPRVALRIMQEIDTEIEDRL